MDIKKGLKKICCRCSSMKPTYNLKRVADHDELVPITGSGDKYKTICGKIFQKKVTNVICDSCRDELWDKKEITYA